MYVISMFKSERDAECNHIQMYDTFKEFGDTFKKCKKGGKLGSGYIRCESVYRKDEDCEPSRILIIDGDCSRDGGNAPSPRAAHIALKELGYNHFVYTTHSHSKDKNKWRAVIAAGKYERKDLKANNVAIIQEMKARGCSIKHVKEMDSFSQIWFLPRRDDLTDGMYAQYEYYDGSDWETIHVEESEAEETEGKEKADQKGYTSSLEELHENIRTGREYHESLRTLSYQYIVDGMSSANTKALLKSIMEGSKDAGTDRWQTRYNDIDRMVDGAVSRNDFDRIGDAPDVRTGRIPSFPNGVMSTWPEPWPMIYEAYSSVARDPVEELLIPTILSTCAHLLNNKYITMEGKLLNLIFLNLASSGVGKDANTTSILKELSNIFLRVESSMPIDPFNQFTQFNKSLSSDTAFMQCFNDEGDFFWVNTEATRIFEMMGTKGNSSVAAISDKLVEVGDGMGISSKKKVSAKDAAPSQPNPNCQVLLCAQPDTISSYLTHNMIDSGLFGRPLVSVSAAEFDYDEYDMFGRRDVRKLKLSDDFIDLFIHLYKIEKRGNGGIFKQIALGAEGDQTRELNTWMKNKIMPHMKSDPMLMTVLRRMGIPIEQVYTVVLAIINEYEELRGYNKTVRIDIALLIPLFDFWVDCKVYATNHLVKNDADPLAKAIQEVMIECINGTIGMSKTGHVKAIKERKIPLARLSNILQCRSTLLKELELSGDRVGLQNRVKQTISALIDLGVIIKCKSGSISCIAFAD